MNQGLSVIICCFNSSARIGDTLRALAKQELQSQISWEVILVDNACTDNTCEEAATVWANLNTGIALRIVSESQPGLGFARKKGIREARYEFILFCDDDNWLDKEYVQEVVDILAADENVAACGGIGIPVFETPEPEWFRTYEEAFAIGPQDIGEKGKIYNLYGAGLALKR